MVKKTQTKCITQAIICLTVCQTQISIPDQQQFHLLVWPEWLELSHFFQMPVPCQALNHPIDNNRELKNKKWVI